MKFTNHLGLKKPEYPDLADIKDINENMDTLDQAYLTLEKEVENYSAYMSNKDGDGIFTSIVYKDKNGNTQAESTLSNPDTDGNYQTVTWTFTDGRPNIVTELTYDEDGDIVSKVVVV